uniref:U4/U6.U5 small nuclear ribonucleoprotein 27 kDa protein n=1 Tax=Caligus clemensi TaxID=344056 RepID=C1C306_CALCM|nr:U4/U6.U5 tri-snRNP-associated protein 3 [Caligus clemensi]
MTRSRSRSRERPRRRSRERHTRRRSRSREQRRHRREESPPSVSRGQDESAAWDREREKKRKEKAAQSLVLASQHPLPYSETEIAGKSTEELELMKTMGFSGFESTKNKKVKGNQVGGVHVVMKRKYRQYMNRKGGFNRPLDYVH